MPSAPPSPNANSGPFTPFAAFPAFDHQPRTRLVFGPGSSERTGELARDLGLKSVLLVTDAGVGCQEYLHSLEPSDWLLAGTHQSAKLVAFGLAKIDSISYVHSQSPSEWRGPWMNPK